MDFISFSYVILFAIVLAAPTGDRPHETEWSHMSSCSSWPKRAFLCLIHSGSFLIILLTSAFIDEVMGRLFGYVDALRPRQNSRKRAGNSFCRAQVAAMERPSIPRTCMSIWKLMLIRLR